MSQKLLTVTVPCYNSQDYMRGCVESLLTGGERVEIIIIDDGSTDATGAIADEYASKYPKILLPATIFAIKVENNSIFKALA